MTPSAPPGGRYADSVPNSPPAEPNDWLPFVAGGVAVICVTLAVLALVDRAWLDCAGDLEAGGRFASRFELLVLVLPATLLATTLAAAIPATALFGKSDAGSWCCGPSRLGYRLTSRPFMWR